MIKRVQLYSPYAWAGGVLDAGGHFYLSRGPKGWSTTVRVTGPQATLDEFARVMVLPYTTSPIASITVPARHQERVLGQLLPYMVGQKEGASVVYRYRVTAPTRRVGWKLTTPTKTYRKKLKERM